MEGTCIRAYGCFNQEIPQTSLGEWYGEIAIKVIKDLEEQLSKLRRKKMKILENTRFEIVEADPFHLDQIEELLLGVFLSRGD